MAWRVPATFPAVSSIVLGALSELLHNAPLPHYDNARANHHRTPGQEITPINPNLTEEIISNCNQGYTGYNTQSNVSRKAPNVSGLQHHQYFLRKGGEGCKTATETYGQE